MNNEPKDCPLAMDKHLNIASAIKELEDPLNELKHLSCSIFNQSAKINEPSAAEEYTPSLHEVLTEGPALIREKIKEMLAVIQEIKESIF